jgi:hypothetical protein
MICVKLVECIRQFKNSVEVIATVVDENNKEFLGISNFFLMSSETLPLDEDKLSYYLEDKMLDWDTCVPIWD